MLSEEGGIYNMQAVLSPQYFLPLVESKKCGSGRVDSDGNLMLKLKFKHTRTHLNTHECAHPYIHTHTQYTLTLSHIQAHVHANTHTRSFRLYSRPTDTCIYMHTRAKC